MADERRISRRERRAAARRVQIMEGAAQVFAEKGFARATTKEIADAADVSEGTIYNYFDSKEDLLIGLMFRVANAQLGEREPAFHAGLEEQLDALQEQLGVRQLAEDPEAFYVNILRWRHTFVRENQAILQALLSEIMVNPDFRAKYNEQMVEPFFTLFEAQLSAYAAHDQIRPVDIRVLVRFLFAINLGLLGLYIMDDDFLRQEWESEWFIETLADLANRPEAAPKNIPWR
jgi:AcrR family transcriptional regulator